MAKLQKGYTFTDGTTGTAAELNSLVDSAILLPGAITEQTTTTPDVADSVLFYDTSAAGLRKNTFANVIALVPSEGVAATPSLRALGTGATQAAPGNDTRFPAAITGPRIGHGTSADTAAVPSDLAFAQKNLAGTLNIDWSTWEVFYDVLSGSGSARTYTFTNSSVKPRTITVVLDKGTWTGTIINWPTLKGAAPVWDTSASICVYTFLYIPAYGTVGAVKSL